MIVPILDDRTFAIRDDGLGFFIFGRLPFDSLKFIANYADKRFGGESIINSGIADAVGATMAITSKENVVPWMKKLGVGPGNTTDWLKSCDTGRSSKTLYSVLNANPGALSSSGPSIPLDSDDFGRCYRLMKSHPEWRPRMSEVADRFPVWTPIVEKWDQLVTAFEAGEFKTLDILLSGKQL